MKNESIIFFNQKNEVKKLENNLITKESNGQLYFLKNIKCEGQLKVKESYKAADHIPIKLIRENHQININFDISLMHNGSVILECYSSNKEDRLKRKLVYFCIIKTSKKIVKKIQILNAKIAEFDKQNAIQ